MYVSMVPVDESFKEEESEKTYGYVKNDYGKLFYAEEFNCFWQ